MNLMNFYNLIIPQMKLKLSASGADGSLVWLFAELIELGQGERELPEPIAG